VIVAVSVLD